MLVLYETFFLAFQVWLKFCDFWCGLCKACCSLQLCLVNLLVSWSLVIYSILDAGLLKTRPSELNVPQSSLKPTKKRFILWFVSSAQIMLDFFFELVQINHYSAEVARQGRSTSFNQHKMAAAALAVNFFWLTANLLFFAKSLPFIERSGFPVTGPTWTPNKSNICN